MALHHQKHLFSLPKDITYLNIASQSPSFKAIEQAGINAVLQKSQPQTITTATYFEPVNTLKKLFAKLVDVNEPERIVTIPSVSYGMANVANNIILKQDDEIVVIDEQFPSNIYIWKKLAKQYNATLKVVGRANAADWNKAILEAITPKTAVVAMGNIHWASGTIFNLKEIRAKTKANNALLIIDGSQSVGALPFSVKEIEPDALVCAGYKWLFGPYGCAYAYYGSYFDNGTPIEENWSNRLGSEDFASLTSYQDEHKPLANKYAVGESGSFIYVQMQIAALQQVLEWTPNAIQEYCKTITQEAVSTLESLGCTIEDPTGRAHHLFGVLLPAQISISALKEALIKNKIYVSFRGNYIRLSCHLFNTKEDFEKLTNCIAQFV
jgi:selenocysteine lyase/cysteine desulfurase